jgi:hypothetical protein
MKTGFLGDDKMAFSRKPGALCQGGIFVIVFGPDRRLGRLSFAKRSEEPGVGLTPDNKRSSAGRRANPHFLQADPYSEFSQRSKSSRQANTSIPAVQARFLRLGRSKSGSYN